MKPRWVHSLHNHTHSDMHSCTYNNNIYNNHIKKTCIVTAPTYCTCSNTGSNMYMYMYMYIIILVLTCTCTCT